MVVLFGALAIAMLQIGRTSLGAAFSALGPLVSADPEADKDYARAAVNAVERIAELEGLPHADKIRSRPGFLALAVYRIANEADMDRFALWADQALADRATRHGRVIAFWDAVADAAPAIGMACTIFGLVRMFGAMDDPGTIGPAMAIALLATLHGMILANMIAGPIARRLERLSAMEIAWQRELTDRLLVIGRREDALLHGGAARLRRPPLRESA